MSIWSFIANLFSDLFSATKRAWNHLPASVQTGILNGSGIFNILSQFIGQDPKLTIATIQANYPAENLELLYAGLSAVAKTWGLVVPATLEDLVIVIQTHIKSLDNENWARVLSGGAQILADVLTGGGTPFEIIVTLIQWVFTNLIKPKEIQLVPMPPTAPNALTSGSVS
jgi:hypothetical protein